MMCPSIASAVKQLPAERHHCHARAAFERSSQRWCLLYFVHLRHPPYALDDSDDPKTGISKTWTGRN